MAYTRGRYGIEYDALRRDSDEKPLRRLTWGVVGVLAVVSFVTARGCLRNVWVPGVMPPPVTEAEEPLPTPVAKVPQQPVTQPIAPATNAVAPTVARPSEPRRLTPAARLVRGWLAESVERPALERTLLEKLFAAECAGNDKLALDTLERLRQRPAMADLDEPLARRLGALNRDWLFSQRPSPWTTLVRNVRKGDGIRRIAREHGTTVAAVLRLNRLPKDAATVPENTRALRVMEFPRAVLVIHKRTKQADLTLNGKYFRRYYASTAAHAKPLSYPVTRETGPRMRLEALGVTLAPADLDEIAMLLPPGATIVITDP